MKGKICLTLTISHLLALLSITYTPSPPPKKNHKIVVRTMKALAPSIATSSSLPKKQVATPQKTVSPPIPQKKQVESPKKTVIPAPIKESPKKTTKQSPSTQKKPPLPQKKEAPPPVPPPLSQNLQKSLKEIEETIAKIASNNDKMSSKRVKEIPPKIDPFPADLTLPFEIEEDYCSSLITYLQDHLRLPDSGEVKIELKLFHDGSIETVKVLSAKSEQNRKRLEEHIPRLQFPPFPKEDKGQKSKVFILTFCNDF